MVRALSIAAVALGAFTSCGGADCATDYFDWNVMVTVDGLPDVTDVTACIDATCDELSTGESEQARRFTGWLDLPDDEVDIEATLTDSSGTVLASFSERIEPVGDACYRNVTLVADAQGIRWSDG